MKPSFDFVIDLNKLGSGNFDDLLIVFYFSDATTPPGVSIES